MNVKITPAPLRGTLAAIASKSDAHRLLICAAFADRVTEISLASTSRDIEATGRCLAALGAGIEKTETGLRVTPVKQAERSPLLDCGESGSTLRFLLPVAAAVSGTPTLTGAGRLPERPVAPLLAALEQRGKTVVSRTFPLKLAGKLTPGTFAVPGNISSQFVSGLLLASPLTGGTCEVKLTSPLVSEQYVGMTASAMRRFGAPVKLLPDGFAVTAAAYRSPGAVNAEGDWSNAAFWLAAAALGGDVVLTGLPLGSLQPDSRILDILKHYGANVSHTGETVKCMAGGRRPFDLETDRSPDLVPVLCVLAAGADGVSRIHNVERLRGKESDRVESCMGLVRALGGEIELQGGDFLIRGRPLLPGGYVDAAGDHRIVMAAAAASAACTGPVEIGSAQAADKSYPRFFEDFKALGGVLSETGKDGSHE